MDIQHVSGFGFCITDNDATGLCALVLVSLVDSKVPNCWVRGLLFFYTFCSIHVGIIEIHVIKKNKKIERSR